MSWNSNRGRSTSTAARGYGTAHRRERQRRLPLYSSADPCGACGRPLGPDRRLWHLPHSDDRTHYLPGFWCAPCNLTDGARRGRARQTSTRLQW